MGNVPPMAPRPAERRIGSLVLSSKITKRRGARPALSLLFAAAWVFAGLAWAGAAWTAAPLHARQSVRLDLGYEAEDLVPPEALLGEWQAVTSLDGKPQPVSLSVKDVTPGKTAGKMIFASPMRCVIDLEYGGPDRGRHIFYMIRFTNCFDYGRGDFIALAPVPDEDAATLSAHGAKEAAKRRRAVEILKKFDLGQSGPKKARSAVPIDQAPAAKPPNGLARIVYVINLAGQVQDSAILNRK